MAKQNLGKIMMTPKGVYNNSTTYEFLDVVTYEGSSYVCKQATTGNLPTTDYWQLLANQGDKPVVGVDYFTEDDKKEIADSVIESSSEDIDELFNALPSNTASGTEINITDSINCRCIETKFNGMSIQDGEPSPTTPVEIVSLGYENLFKPTLVADDGNLIAVGNGTAELVGDVFKLTAIGSDLYFGQICIEGTTYNPVGGVLIDVSNISVISYKLSNPLFTRNFITAYDENLMSLGYTDVYNCEGTYTIPSGAKYISMRIGCNNNAVIGKTYEIKVLITNGDKVYNYIPYGKYGVGVKTIGKNLAKPRDMSTDNGYNGITAVGNADGSFTVTGTCTGDMAIQLMDLKTAPIFLKNGKSYTQKLFLISGSGNFQIVPYVLNLDGTTTYNYLTSTIESPTFTRKVDGDKTVMGYQFYCLKGATVNVTFKVQLEEGTVATEYQPYQENISVIPLNEPLRSLPNGVKDRAYLKNNKLYVDRYVGSVVFNGSEKGDDSSGWRLYDISGNTLRRYGLRGNSVPQSLIMLSNLFVCSDYDTGRTTDLRLWTQAQYWAVSDANSKWVDANSFKNWLSENNLKVIYELATPVTEYLGTIEDLPRTFEGGCNITADSNIDNVELEIKYAQDIKAYINNLIK